VLAQLILISSITQEVHQHLITELACMFSLETQQRDQHLLMLVTLLLSLLAVLELHTDSATITEVHGTPVAGTSTDWQLTEIGYQGALKAFKAFKELLEARELTA
jgi:hypothetical protein